MDVKEDFYGNESGKGEDEKLKETEKEIEKILLKKEREKEKELKRGRKESKINIHSWFRSLINPAEVFREEKKNANLVGAVKNVGVSVGLFLVLMYALIFCLIGIMAGEGVVTVIIVAINMIFLVSIIYIIILFMLSGMRVLHNSKPSNS